MTPSPGLQIKDSRRTWPSVQNRRSSSSKLFTSSMSLDESDSSEDSTYSSPRSAHSPGSSSTLPRPCCKGRSLSDYETEINELRVNMESLQQKLNETERRLRVVSKEGEEESTAVCRTLQRLSIEEDLLRRQEIHSLGDKEMMILMQQKKIAALDDANGRLKNELCRLGDKLKSQRGGGGQQELLSVVHTGDSPVRVFHKSSSVSMETPKTVDELLDSLHSTPI
eukprot:TRINITY_DN7832_c0_g1_i2.p1 TRINITY_DN7832_c0_g1~~TRINITY_DN7832_c0_g1_i2.p1  ORF type:complete len:224 (+),score=98.55 TRINITY_DN7832_c0_g1_i2:398-1069(+)